MAEPIISQALLTELARLARAGGRVDHRTTTARCLDLSHSLMGDEAASLLLSAAVATAKLSGAFSRHSFSWAKKEGLNQIFDG
jgi:hypothetical protein